MLFVDISSVTGWLHNRKHIPRLSEAERNNAIYILETGETMVTGMVTKTKQQHVAFPNPVDHVLSLQPRTATNDLVEVSSGLTIIVEYV